jgi:hypothetical protein
MDGLGELIFLSVAVRTNISQKSKTFYTIAQPETNLLCSFKVYFQATHHFEACING